MSFVMPQLNQIRARFDADTITIYQAYAAPIARAAIENQKFVAPFSMQRMTWIKPSYLWLMERSNWAQKSGQEHILAVTISRNGWDEALSLGVLTGFEPKIHLQKERWEAEFEKALVHVQWDPERSIRGADLGFNSIQVGISRHLIERFVEEWIVKIEDLTPQTRKIHGLIQAGRIDNARKLLPVEKIYPVEAKVARRLDMI